MPGVTGSSPVSSTISGTGGLRGPPVLAFPAREAYGAWSGRLWCLVSLRANGAEDGRRDEATAIVGGHADDRDPFTRPHEGVVSLRKLADIDVHGLARALRRHEELTHD